MRILFLLVVLSVTSALQSQVVIKENAIQSKYAFPLVTSKAKAVVVMILMTIWWYVRLRSFLFRTSNQ